MFGKFSMLAFIAAVALVVAAVPAPVSAQLEASAVAGYGVRSEKHGYPATATRGPLVRGGALVRVVGPVALGGEIGHCWLGEVRWSDFFVERDRILNYGLCVELGKPRPGFPPICRASADVHLKEVKLSDDSR